MKNKVTATIARDSLLAMLLVSALTACTDERVQTPAPAVSTGTKPERNDSAYSLKVFGTVTGIHYSPTYGLFVGAGDWGQTTNGYDPTSVVTLIH